MGYGDELMITGEVKNLKKKYPDTKFIIGDGIKSYWSTIFENNPNIIKSEDVNNFSNIKWIHNYPHNRPYRNYSKELDKNKYNWNKDYKAIPGEIFFSNTEIEFSENIIKKINTKRKIIFIEPHVKKRRGFENWDWGFENWQSVVNNLKNEYLFLQCSFGDQKKLQNVISLHGANFRAACSIMSKTDLFIGPHGGFNHAAAALNKKAIIIFGGWISPKNVGYDFHTNIYIEHEMSPCGNKIVCSHCKNCLKKINVEDITQKIRNILG
tara:strand:+ start:56 stop:856 length:801 start_codon:yes stop_codon:yes gene_type:complete